MSWALVIGANDPHEIIDDLWDDDGDMEKYLVETISVPESIINEIAEYITMISRAFYPCKNERPTFLFGKGGRSFLAFRLSFYFALQELTLDVLGLGLSLV